MAKKEFDPSNLQAFGHAAAGHDGVLSDSSGAVVVKPCTQAEVTFYETITTQHPDLAPHLPTYMGTLSLASTDPKVAAEITEAAESGTIQTEHGIERLHGRKLDTELHIVLENITYGFKKPNVLDLKLGAQLWDEDAKPEKRARLDEVSNSSTSGSLGFRVAGMRTYKGPKAPEVPEKLKKYAEDNGAGFWVYNKMYGRVPLQAENIDEGFESYVLPGGRSERELERARDVLSYFASEVRDIQQAFEKKESRMYSASLLLVYEGDIDEYEKSKALLADATKEEVGEEDEDDEEDLPKLAVVKVIDFAHATWHPGKGPDENAIRGMRSTGDILERLLEKVEKEIS